MKARHDLALSAEPLNVIEMCTGVGMLGEGLRSGLAYLGFETRAICYVEREAHAAAVLAARCEDGSLDDAPVWSDLRTFDSAAWRGCVDIIAAGFPCQDISLAGRRAGLDGKRSGLFFDILDHADACGADGLFLENVAAITTAVASVVDEASASDYAAKPDGSGFSDVGVEDGRLFERAAARVLGELADRGWDAEWINLRAADVGASHGRERWFCIAWRRGIDMADTARHERRGLEDGAPGCGRRVRQAGDELGQPEGIGREERRAEPAGQQGRHDAAVDGGAVADAEGGRAPAAEQPGQRDGAVAQHDAVADTGHGTPGNGDARGAEGAALEVGRGALGAADSGGILADAGHGPRAHEPLAVAGRRHQAELRGSGAAVAHADMRGLGKRGRRRVDRSGESTANAVERGGMADAGQPGLPDAEPAIARGARRWDEGRATAQLRRPPFLFAPGPSDERWPAILEAFPEFAPALEPDFRMLADGLDFYMGDSRAARLKCVGNGVAPLQAAGAFVCMVLRARGVLQ